MYQVFLKYDATQLEINPFANTNRGVISVDAKFQVDDNAKFRQVCVYSYTAFIFSVLKETQLAIELNLWSMLF